MRSCGPHEADLPKGLGRSHGDTADDPQRSCLYVPQVLCYVKALLKYNLHQEAKLSCSFRLLGTGAGLEKKAMAGMKRKEVGQPLPLEGKGASPATVKSGTSGKTRCGARWREQVDPFEQGTSPGLPPYFVLITCCHSVLFT